MKVRVETKEEVVKRIKDIPSVELKEFKREFVVQEGRCKVWVHERLEPLTPVVSKKHIAFPYYIHRRYHKYNCVDQIFNSGHTHNTSHRNPSLNLDFASKVTADYTFEDHVLKITNIYDHGKFEESDAGSPIVRKLQLFSPH